MYEETCETTGSNLTLMCMKAPIKPPKGWQLMEKLYCRLPLPIHLCSTIVSCVFSQQRASPQRSQNGSMGGPGRCGQFVFTWWDCLSLLQRFMKSADILHMLFMPWSLASCNTSVRNKWGQINFHPMRKLLVWQYTNPLPEIILQIHPTTTVLALSTSCISTIS